MTKCFVEKKVKRYTMNTVFAMEKILAPYMQTNEFVNSSQKNVPEPEI